jgi:single-strand DNA-binding protein
VVCLFREYDKNEVILCGFACLAPQPTHKTGGVEYFGFPLRVPRLSGREDVLNVTAPSYVLPDGGIEPLSKIYIRGVMRSRNVYENNRYRLIISVCGREIRPESADSEPANSVKLAGSICKPPIYRETPLGRRVCDIMLAVKRSYGKADFLPLIVWGCNADMSKDFCVGDRIECEGRFQSREYLKRTETTEEIRTAYEISVSKINKMTGMA